MSEFLTAEELVLEIEKSRKYFLDFMVQFKNNRDFWDDEISNLQLKILETDNHHVIKGEFRSYIILSLRRRYIDIGRSNIKKYLVFFSQLIKSEKEIASLFTPFVNPDSSCEGKDIQSFLKRSKIKDVCKDLLILYYLEDLSIKEIQAQYTDSYKVPYQKKEGISEGNIKSILFSARKELKELLELKGVKSYEKAISIFNH